MYSASGPLTCRKYLHDSPWLCGMARTYCRPRDAPSFRQSRPLRDPAVGGPRLHKFPYQMAPARHKLKLAAYSRQIVEALSGSGEPSAFSSRGNSSKSVDIVKEANIGRLRVCSVPRMCSQRNITLLRGVTLASYNFSTNFKLRR